MSELMRHVTSRTALRDEERKEGREGPPGLKEVWFVGQGRWSSVNEQQTMNM